MSKQLIKIIGCWYVIIVLAGCSHTVTFIDQSKTHEIYNYKKIDIVPSEQLLALHEESSCLGFHSQYEVGNLIDRLFDKNSNSNINMELVLNQLKIKASDVMIFGTRFDSEYELTVTLSNQKLKKVISVKGISSSMRDTWRAGQDSIEDALFKVYKLANVYVQEFANE